MFLIQSNLILLRPISQCPVELFFLQHIQFRFLFSQRSDEFLIIYGNDTSQLQENKKMANGCELAVDRIERRKLLLNRLRIKLKRLIDLILLLIEHWK